MTAVRRIYRDGIYGQVHYRIARPKAPAHRPVVCFHLSPLSGLVFEPLMISMGTDRIVLAPDTPGFGASDGPESPPSITDYADAMADFVDSLGYDDIDVFGYHTGSKISVELARRRPDLVRHVAIVSAPVYNESELEEQRSTMGSPPRLHESGSHLLNVWQGHWQWRGSGQTLEMVQKLVAEAYRGGPNAWWGHRAAFQYRIDEWIGTVQQPLIVLCPDDDLAVATRRVEPFLGNGKLLPLPGWGHGMLDLHTNEIAELLRDFFDDEVE